MFTQKNVFGTVCVTECSGTVPCNVKVMRLKKTKCRETEHNFILGPQPDHEYSGCSDFQCGCIYVRTYVYIEGDSGGICSIIRIITYSMEQGP